MFQEDICIPKKRLFRKLRNSQELEHFVNPFCFHITRRSSSKFRISYLEVTLYALLLSHFQVLNFAPLKRYFANLAADARKITSIYQLQVWPSVWTDFRIWLRSSNNYEQQVVSNDGYWYRDRSLFENQVRKHPEIVSLVVVVVVNVVVVVS